MPAEELAVCLEIIRRQRHDFLNHLQVLSGLLQLRKPEQALAYIREITQQCEKISGILHLKSPKLALTMLRWGMEAEKQDIQVRFAGSTDLARLEVDEGKLVTVVGEIWQRVIAALKELPWERRYLTVRLQDHEDGCSFLWEVAANEHLTSSYWRKALLDLAVAAREIWGELGWQQQGVNWVVELRLAVQGSP